MKDFTIESILLFLDQKEIDFRLVSNHCCGYIFYFLDGSIYPRRYYDYDLENIENKVICESVDHMIEKAVNNELQKDWIFRIEGDDLNETFELVHKYLLENCKSYT